MNHDSGSSSFHTDWVAINQAARSEDVLHDLVTRYLKRLQRHARIQWRNLSPEDVEDFVQSFVVKMLSGNIFAGADPSKGRFRTFFLRCFDNHVKDHLKRPSTDEASLADFQLPEQETREIWAVELFEAACESMRVACERHGLNDIWQIAQDRFILPILEGAEPLSYERLMQKYDLGSMAAAAGKVRTVKKRLDLAVRNTIGAYTQEPGEMEWEVREFVAALPRQVRFDEPPITTAEFLHSNWRYDLAHYGILHGEMTWDDGGSELPTYADLLMADRPPVAALTAVKEMAKQWVKNKVTEIPKRAQITLYFLPSALAETCHQKEINKLPKGDIADSLMKLCQQTEDPLPDELKFRIAAVVQDLV